MRDDGVGICRDSLVALRIKKYPYQAPNFTLENGIYYLDTKEGKLPLEISHNCLVISIERVPIPSNPKRKAALSWLHLEHLWRYPDSER